MNRNNIVNVILSGGSGTRLWPLSRASKPKQFLQMFNNLSLFQHTVKRNQFIVDNYLLITNSTQIFEAQKQVKEIGVNISKKVIEPIGRNTAPAIALAALSLGKDAIMIVTPSDHMIADEELYRVSMKRAIELANNDFLVTFGIQPTEPNTGFGYIEYEKENVISFREKPDLKTAEEFLKKGNFNWNSGMFCFKASVFLEELKMYNPKMYEASIKAFESIENGEVAFEAMKQIPSDSIDYAVMEKSKRIKTVSADFYWTDLGTFDAIINYFEEGNDVVNLHRVLNKSTYSFSDKKIFTNVDDLIVVNTMDSIVILKKNNSNDIKSIYNKVKEDYPELIE